MCKIGESLTYVKDDIEYFAANPETANAETLDCMLKDMNDFLKALSECGIVQYGKNNEIVSFDCNEYEPVEGKSSGGASVKVIFPGWKVNNEVAAKAIIENV